VGAKVIALLRLTVAGVFLVAGVMKIWDFANARSATPDFTIAVQSYHLLPSPDLAVLLAVYLPWLEIIAAVAVFTRRLSLGASAAMLGMSATLLAAIGSAWWRGLDIVCGCFGRDEVSPDYRMLILRDLALLAACGVVFLHEWRRAGGAGVTAAKSSASSPCPAAGE
jgi:putative oxidoreductase